MSGVGRNRSCFQAALGQGRNRVRIGMRRCHASDVDHPLTIAGTRPAGGVFRSFRGRLLRFDPTRSVLRGPRGPILPPTASRSLELAELEAVLFLCRSPQKLYKIAQLAGLPDATRARTLIDRLNEIYDKEGSAFRVECIAGGYRLYTRATFAPWLRRLHGMSIEVRLSPPALETLAVVAYKQPVMRADLEAVRGVQCGEILRQLIERGLVRIAGRADLLGRPFLYGTTRRFLEVFGLGSLDQLPIIEGADEDLAADLEPGMDFSEEDSEGNTDGKNRNSPENGFALTGEILDNVGNLAEKATLVDINNVNDSDGEEKVKTTTMNEILVRKNIASDADQELIETLGRNIPEVVDSLEDDEENFAYDDEDDEYEDFDDEDEFEDDDFDEEDFDDEDFDDDFDEDEDTWEEVEDDWDEDDDEVDDEDWDEDDDDDWDDETEWED